MNTFSLIVDQVALVHQDYRSHLQSIEHEKDGQQLYLMGCIAAWRLSFLAATWKKVIPNLRTRGLTYVPIVLGCLATVGVNSVSHYVKKQGQEKDNRRLLLAHSLIQLGQATGRFLNNHLNKMINVAVTVSYIALIALGHPMIGTIGLAGMGLVALKETGNIPAWADRYLKDLILITSLVLIFHTPVGTLTSLFLIQDYGVHFSHFIDRHNVLKSYLPLWFSEPLKDLHIIEETDKLETKELSYIEEKTTSDDHFTINISSVYTNALSELLPTDVIESIAQADPHDLWSELTAKISVNNVKLSNNEQKGLEKIRKGFVENTYPDHAPPNLDHFMLYLKGVCHSLLGEEINFSNHIRELAEIGNSCSEGWTRAIITLLNPKTTDPYWAVHHYLAEIRSELVKEALCDVDQRVKNKSGWAGLNFDVYGGATNVHSTNALQSLFWHRLRTRDAEIYHNIYGTDIFDKFGAWWLASRKDRSFSKSEWLFILHRIFELHPALGSMVPFFKSKMEHVDKKYDAPFVVQAVKTSFEMGYRKIPWKDGITKWIQKMESQVDGLTILDTTTGKWNAKWVTIDDFGRPSLTEAGIRLLLWDLGIIHPARAA